MSSVAQPPSMLSTFSACRRSIRLPYRSGMNQHLNHQLLVATSNPGKIRELRALLPVDLSILSLEDLGLRSPEETGATLQENAELKALHAEKEQIENDWLAATEIAEG